MTVLDEAPSDTTGEPTDARGRVAELHGIRAQALAGPEREGDRGAARQGQADRPRAHRAAARRGLLHGGRAAAPAPGHRVRPGGARSRTPTVWSPAGARWTGRTVFVYAHDFRIFGGALGEAHADEDPQDHGHGASRPVRRWSSLNDGAGARIQEGVTALAGYGGIFQRNTRASGVIPQISVMLGPCAGGAAYSPGAHRLRVHGPRDLADVHHRPGRGPGGDRRGDHPERPRRRRRARRDVSGVAHFAYDDEETCLDEVRYLLSLLPANNRENPPRRRAGRRPGRPALRRAARPGARRRQPAVRHARGHRGDRRRRRRTSRSTSAGPRNIICALARLDGQVVGIVANQPRVAGRRAGHRRLGEGRPLRPDLRRVQHPAGHPAGRARLPARRRPGARRHHPARRQAAVRLLQRHRARGSS